jgi:hypothetical protein
MNAVTNFEVDALISSLTNDIDALYILDQQAKAMAERVKKMKDDIANKYGESAKDINGKYIPFKGELHEVTVQLVAVKGTVDYGKLCVKYGITDDVLDTFRKDGRADIKVVPAK